MKTLNEIKGEIRALERIRRYAKEEIKKLDAEAQELLTDMREEHDKRR